jgi:hypothetical protein
MGILLTASRLYLPRSIQKSRLIELFRATADAFQRPSPRLRGYSLDQRLTIYALFTAVNVEGSIRRGDEYQVKGCLYRNARQIGEKIRAQLKIQSLEEVMEACEVIYKALKIEFHGDSQGQICIPNCFFSSYYSPDVCRVISSLDEGLLTGLSGGLRLKFSRRITEGGECCRAQLLPAGRP